MSKIIRSNRDRLHNLIEISTISQVRAADIIANQTARPCSVRAVRSWLANPEISSARTCPDWAIEALIKGLKKEQRG